MLKVLLKSLSLPRVVFECSNSASDANCASDVAPCAFADGILHPLLALSSTSILGDVKIFAKSPKVT
jgi:hypothetical protein